MAYSKELQNVIQYMENVLAHEFPCKKITPEYLLTAILDCKKCYANELLSNCLMSANITSLKKIYLSWLENSSKDVRETILAYDDSLVTLLSNADKESALIGGINTNTTHVLLAMLNVETHLESVREVFKNMGIDYDFIINKIAKTAMENIEASQKKTPQANTPKPSLKPIPLKSDINKLVITGSVEFINKYTININDLVSSGKVDPLIGRQDEITQAIKILARRKKNNVIFLGEGGCGKSSLVYGIAEAIINDAVPTFLKNKEIVMLNPMALVSGTNFRGMFEERVKGLFDELKQSTKHILFIDDIQTVLKSSSKEKDTDISAWISDILNNGEVKVVATASFKDYRNTVESNPVLSHKFQKIVVNPLTPQETIEVIWQNKALYENYHKVTYSKEVIEYAVKLASRYINDRCLPDSAIDVIDLSGAYTCFVNRDPQNILDVRKKLFNLANEKDNLLNHGEFEAVEALSVEEQQLKNIILTYERNMEKNPSESYLPITQEHIATSVSNMTQIPLSKLSVDDKAKLRHIEDVLKEHIVGQDEAIDSVCKAIKRSRVGLSNPNKPSGVFLSVGGSGVGKSLLAKKLAQEIYGDENNLVRIDMSEFAEKSSVAKLLGSNPGYVGFENGGRLTEAIKHKQHCVLLLDEIEKADPEVYNVFLPLFDEGRLTDSAGQEVNFKNVIIVMTSNVGAKEASELGKGLGFSPMENQNKQRILEKSLKKKFSPEFINRIDKIIHFNPLSDDNLKNIVKLELGKFTKRLNSINFNYAYNDDVVETIFKACCENKELGARPIIRTIQELIEDDIANLMLERDYPQDYTFVSTVKENKIITE